MKLPFADLATDPEAEGRAILADAVGLFRPAKVFALFSGGHDSLCASHLATAAGLVDGCVHINTGIGVERTRQFVRDTCRGFGWPLREMTPPPFVPKPNKRRPGIDYENLPAYEALVFHFGFPGADGHTLIYNRLKERCLRQLVCEAKGRRGDRVLLVTGVRRQESRRRMGHIVPTQREGCRVWAAPLVNWDQAEKEAYLAAKGLPRNPVVDGLCMSGECLCGAYAKEGELHEISTVDPKVATYLRGLMERARALGAPHCIWGEKTKPNSRRKRKAAREPSLGLCWSCEAKREAG
jgi:3'-phosphoadenosine 5'-phosphosulfate sulfotransferase (PAPS reductase)/FAD synthetase